MSHEKFEVGEVAFVMPFPTPAGPIDHPEYQCTEVTIIGPLYRTMRSHSGWAYRVRCADGRELSANPRVLRKKLPPEHLVESDEREVSRV